MIDIHAHVLPGLDDGPPSLDESVDLVRLAVDGGVHTIVAKPHMHDGVHNVRRAEALEAGNALRQALAEAAVEVKLLPGGDVHVDVDLDKRLADGELITLADGGRYLMVELPQHVVPDALRDLLFRLQLRAVRPILSHPERHPAFQAEPALLAPLVRAGCLVQVTAASLLGRFGERAAGCVRALLDRQMVHFVASDMHGVERRRPRLAEAAVELRQRIDPELAEEILVANPAAAIAGRDVEPPEPVTPRRRRWFFW
jgi:protein-tyrosine phosphatase